MDTFSFAPPMAKRLESKSLKGRRATASTDKPPKRNSKRCTKEHLPRGQRVMPKNLTPNKDKTTPSLRVRSSMYHRMQRRKWRGLPTFDPASLLNEACHLKMADHPPLNASRKTREIYNSVHSLRRLKTEGQTYCGICRATTPQYCHCGAFLEVAPVALRDFMAFVKSPRNPILNYSDPADQEGIQRVLVKLGASSCRELCRVLFTISMISNEAVMEEIGEDIKTKRIAYLRTMFKHRSEEGRATFRGGQFAGAVPVADLADALAEFCDKALAKLTPRLLEWQAAGQDRTKCVNATRAVLEIINTCDVYGFGKYKQKKFAEFLILAAMGDVLSLHFQQAWLNDLRCEWPLPDNSVKNLKLIFPGIVNYRSGVVALLRGLKKSHITFPVIVAQLCFWSEQRNGRIDWL